MIGIKYNSMSVILFSLCFVSSCFICIPGNGQQCDSQIISIQTRLGEIEAVLFLKQAPRTCANFLKYIDLVGEQGGEFYRTVTPDNQPASNVKIEVIQGGFNLAGIDTGGILPVLLERTAITGLSHKNGTLSMARSDPDSGSTEFFICIGNQPELDFGGKRNPDGQGFAAFGMVTRGMDVVKKIQQCPSEAQSLTPPVSILRIVKSQR
jgi:peptidyl-prolyl cis-trans isomerase A (cyclophilin A)